jgi:uncharacterized protein
MYLVDTNVWVELLCEQDRANEVMDFFRETPPRTIHMTDFSLFSIGIILGRLGKDDSFGEFVQDTLERGAVRKVTLSFAELKEIPAVCRAWGLDLDDAYQYVAAINNDLALVSFDRDFDRTDRKRKTPRQAIL